MDWHLRFGVVVVLAAVAVAACSQALDAPSTQPTVGSTNSPAAVSSPSPAASAEPSATASASHVTSPAQAAALVLASDPAYNFVWPGFPEIGGSAWNEATESGDGYSVSVTLGSGDCPAGCIHQHISTYAVDRDGAIRLVNESGDSETFMPVHPSTAPASVTVKLVSGPTCPVERDPPDPECAPRPLADTAVVLRDPSGTQLASIKTDVAGTVSFTLPGGAYYVEPAPVDGLMGQAQPVAFSVPGGSSMTFALNYDTGIR